MVIAGALSGGSIVTAVKLFAQTAAKDVTKFIVNLLVSVLAVVSSFIAGLVLQDPALAWEDLGLKNPSFFLAIIGAMLPFSIDLPEVKAFIAMVRGGGDVTRVSLGPPFALLGDVLGLGLLLAAQTLTLNSTVKFVTFIIAGFFAPFAFWTGFPATPAGKLAEEGLSIQPVTIITQASSDALLFSATASALCIAIQKYC